MFDKIGVLKSCSRRCRWFVPGLHVLLFLVSGLLAFLLRFEFGIPARALPHLYTGLWVWVLVKLLVFALFGLNHGRWRHLYVHDLLRLTTANVLASGLSAAVIARVASPGFPRSIYIIDLLICLLLTAGVRVAVRIIADLASFRAQAAERTRTLVYGAGDAGASVLREIRDTQGVAYDPVGFIDDDPAKAGSTIEGVRVFGGGESLAHIVRTQRIGTVLLAIPSASGTQTAKILNRCVEAGVVCKTVPSLAEIINGTGLAKHVRDVAVEDLLGRSSVHLDETAIRDNLRDRVVLVTGAGGSIGSELCRQIARFGARAVVAFEVAETPLFQLEQEIRRLFPDLEFHPEIGDIRNPKRLSAVFEQYRPSALYHAAAYKHVPMMEMHVFEAVENNVLGTWNTARAAIEHGVEDFVMISSDKAVRPTSVMGATKRVSELLIHSLPQGCARFVSVRFGNVLGSNGSVLPLFRQQIADGGPVTVTHPEMRRYFMTVAEAVQLVLKASTMGQGGEIFILDMGESVRIQDLARNLILSSGLLPDKDIKIQFTGIRPGEKLNEELNYRDEDIVPTTHHRIKIFAGNGLPKENISRYLEKMRTACYERDRPRLIMTLKELVPEYNPSSYLLHHCLAEEGATKAVAV